MRFLAVAALALSFSGCASSTRYHTRQGVELGPRSVAEKRHAQLVERVPTDLDAPLRVVKSVFPQYDRGLLWAGTEGRVRVDFIVEPDGSVSNARVIGSPPRVLAAHSLASIRKWKFAPPRKGGAPTRAAVSQTFNFKIEREPALTKIPASAALLNR